MRTLRLSGGNGAGTLERRRLGGGPGPPVAGSPSGLAPRRRWGFVLVGVGAMIVGGWVSASLWLRAGDRVEVVALASDVEAYETIARDDLRTVRVAAPEGVDVVRAGRIDDMVGRVATSDLPARSLLVEAHLFPADDPLVSASEAVVGVRLDAGEAPVELAQGGAVLAVVRPPSTADTADGPVEARAVEGWVLRTREVSTGAEAGSLAVSVVVLRDEATAVSAASAEDRLSLVALGE